MPKRKSDNNEDQRQPKKAFIDTIKERTAAMVSLVKKKSTPYVREIFNLSKKEDEKALRAAVNEGDLVKIEQILSTTWVNPFYCNTQKLITGFKDEEQACQILQLFIKYGLRINDITFGNSDTTMVILAAQNPSTKILQALVEGNANIHLTRTSALHEAVEAYRPNNIKYLLEAKADVHYESSKFHYQTPLNTALDKYMLWTDGNYINPNKELIKQSIGLLLKANSNIYTPWRAQYSFGDPAVTLLEVAKSRPSIFPLFESVARPKPIKEALQFPLPDELIKIINEYDNCINGHQFAPQPIDWSGCIY